MFVQSVIADGDFQSVILEWYFIVFFYSVILGCALGECVESVLVLFHRVILECSSRVYVQGVIV